MQFKKLEPSQTGSLSYGGSYLGMLFYFLNGLEYLVSSWKIKVGLPALEASADKFWKDFGWLLSPFSNN